MARTLHGTLAKTARRWIPGNRGVGYAGNTVETRGGYAFGPLRLNIRMFMHI